MTAERFNEQYFGRFYFSRRTRVAAPLEYLARARLLAAYADLHGIRLRRALDAGAGPGYFARALDAVRPGIRVTGIDISDYACQRYGWTRASVTDYACRRPFDLVVCCDVAQYLARTAAAEALQNLVRLCSGILYFTVLTREDWTARCDQSRTDGNVHLRPARWYRDRLRPHFHHVGTGVYLARSLEPALFALDDMG